MSRLMVIGWDSSDFALLNPWLQQGLLPNLRKLMESSRAGNLKSVYPPVTATAWSTIITGKNPGRHGIYEFFQFRPNTYDAYPVNASNRISTDVWEILSQYNKKVVVVGVPITYPVREVNGYMVSGLLTPNEDVSYTYPEQLKTELKTQVPGYSVNPTHVHDENAADEDQKEEDYVRLLFEVLDKHTRGAAYLAENKVWDFFMAVFNESDWCQHRYWSTIDPDHPKYTKSRAEKFGNVIRDVHVKLDSALGELMKIAGPETNIILLSDHGAGPLYKIMNTNHFLHRIGMLKLKRKPSTIVKYALARFNFNPVSVYKLIKIMRVWNKSVYASRNDKKVTSARKIFLTKEDIDWSRTQAFAPFGNGQIFINKKEKFPAGIITDDMYDKTVQKIINELDKLYDSEFKIVETAFRNRELYVGPESRKCPDVQFHPRRGYLPIGSFSYGVSNLLTDSYGVSGTHGMNGILVIRSSLFHRGTQIDNANLVDIAPTILEIMGLPIPKDIDGRPLVESNAKPEISSTFQEEQKNLEKSPTHSLELTKEEEQDIEERLRSLGYL